MIQSYYAYTGWANEMGRFGNANAWKVEGEGKGVIIVGTRV